MTVLLVVLGVAVTLGLLVVLLLVSVDEVGLHEGSTMREQEHEDG